MFHNSQDSTLPHGASGPLNATQRDRRLRAYCSLLQQETGTQWAPTTSVADAQVETLSAAA